MADADLVIVGAGVIGAATAYQVARRSDMRVVVLEKGPGPALGSSGDSMAVSRCRYTVPAVVRLARHGQEAYRNWPDFTGIAEPRNRYTKLGGLWVFDRTDDQLDDEYRRLADNGVAVSILTADEVTERWPCINACVAPIDLAGDADHRCRPASRYLYEDDAGFMDPAGATHDLVDAARREGVEVRFRAQVTGLVRNGGAVRGVELADGSVITAPVVLNAGGPWCNLLNRPVDAARRWTLTPTRIQLVHRTWPNDAPRIPIVFDEATSGGFRLEAGGESVVLLVPEVPAFARPVDDPDHFRRTPDDDAVQATMAGFEHRVVGIDHRGRVTGTSGLYTINQQDTHPVLGPSEVDGFWVANGFSGHGFKLAPMVGAMLAEALTGASASYDTDVDIGVFSVEREPLATSGNVFA